MNENFEDLLTNFAELLFHAFACLEKGNYEQAIADYTKVLELSPQLGDDRVIGVTYWGRGFAYIKKGDFLNAFRDFVQANDRNRVLKTQMPEIYVADKIADIYKNHTEEDSTSAFELYLRLLQATSNIQKERFYRPAKGKEVAHYTSLHTLETLATNEHFRLYNANYMNDPEEGRVFFEIMNRWTDIDIDIEDSFYRDSKLHLSPAYIGSFVKVDAQDKEKDKLFLWRTYGKHDEQEAAGTCLIFKHEGTVFAENYRQQIGAMQQLQAKLPMSKGDHQNPEEKQPRKPDLYKIVYSDENLSPLSHVDALRLSRKDYSANRGLSEELNKLAESLKQIKKHIKQEKDNDKKKKLRKLVRDLLDAIRFLFKARHYREEKEVRVVQVRYDEENTTQDEDGIQVDTEQIPPRFYLETDENFRFSEVILGPQTRGVPEWKRWLKERDIKVDQSEIQYGKPYL